MSQIPLSSPHNSNTRSHTYAGLVGLSASGLLLLVASLVVAGRLNFHGIHHLRDFLGYGHFTLAYIFTWKLIRRQLGSVSLGLLYVATFLGMVACYAAAQRWLFSADIDDIVVMVIFMIHHVSNEVLFRQQTINGYQKFPWNPRRIFWVALVVWLVLVDRIATTVHPWRAAGPFICGAWLIGWAIYGWRYLRLEGSALSLVGWSSLGAVVAWRLFKPFDYPLFAWQIPFAWIVIYHYVMWYVFYTRKLLARTGKWVVSGMRWDSLTNAWKAATTVPGGFLALIAVGNLVIFAIYAATLPAVKGFAAQTGLNIFHVNTIAHILFGVGVPNRAAMASAKVKTADSLPQFA